MLCSLSNKEATIDTGSLLQFDKLIGYLTYSFTILPDQRQGFNTTYTIKDAALSRCEPWRAEGAGE